MTQIHFGQLVTAKKQRSECVKKIQQMYDVKVGKADKIYICADREEYKKDFISSEKPQVKGSAKPGTYQAYFVVNGMKRDTEGPDGFGDKYTSKPVPMMPSRAYGNQEEQQRVGLSFKENSKTGYAIISHTIRTLGNGKAQDSLKNKG